MRNRTLSLGSLACLILSSTCLAQTTNWVQVKPQNTPGTRWEHGNAYDFIRGRTILFGGWGTNREQNDTWEYDGNNWTKMNPQTSPSPRRLTTMCYHLAKLTTVLFGGIGTTSTSPTLNDTWTWNGTNWTQMKPQNSPSIRGGHGMAYDSGRGRTVLVGGFNSGFGGLNDTWEWDGANWTQIMTKNSPPAGAACLAYDSARKRIVLFGGRVSSYLNDTWEYDGKDWTKMNPTVKPPARYYAALGYDASRQRTVLFGGLSSGGLLGDTWEYDGKTWVQMNTTAAPAARRDYDQMVYDSRRQRMVIYGGTGGSILGDHWEYGGKQPLTATPSTISIATGGTQTFALDASSSNANRLYWIFGSVTGTSPGVTLLSAAGSVNIPLVPDVYTSITIASPNTAFLVKTRGALDGSGLGQASLVVPKITDQNAIGVKIYHAYLVYDTGNNFYLGSNAVTLTLVQ